MGSMKLRAVFLERKAAWTVTNKAIRKGDNDASRAELVKLGADPEKLDEYFKPDFCGRIGFPAYSGQNRNANMKRIKDRIAALEARKAREPQAVEAAGGVRVVENLELFRVQIIFPGKPDAAVRSELKSRGFRWAPSENAWQRHLNNAGIYAAREIIKYLDAAVNKE